jgi:biotin carboxyl carrier protein
MKYLVLVDGQTIEVEVEGDRVGLQGRTFPATLEGLSGTPLRQLVMNGRPLTLLLERQAAGRWAVSIAGERSEVEVLDQRTQHLRSLTSGAEQRRTTGGLKAPMPGMVVRVLGAPGDTVQAGAGLVVLEAMKMENELKAPATATIRSVRVTPGEAVEKGQLLVEFEPTP